MKVLFIARATLFSNKGGDTIQILNTAKHLQALNVVIDIKLCNQTVDYKDYDLIHFFNIIRPADIMYHIRKSGKPYVVSTIYVNYNEFDRNVRKGLSGFLFRLLPKGLIEYAKVIARAFKNNERIISTEYLWVGHNKAIKKVIRGAALLLPNSHNEYRRLATDFAIDHPYKVIPNAVDDTLFNNNRHGSKINNLILCVGRIEGLKNQLNLIKAMNNTNYQLLIIGSASVNQKNYYQECIKEAGDNVKFIQSLPQRELINYYRQAKVHVLPSWFETTGLSSLEAAAMECNIVVTDKGDTKEYFEQFAFFCDPASPDSIKQAIDQAARGTMNPELQKKIMNNYTWKQAAAKTKEAYLIILSK